MTNLRFATTAPLVAIMLLAGCEEGGVNLPSFGNGQGAQTTDGADLNLPDGVELVERDVEAPNVYNRTDKALWGGRPSLGGVWVAHPDVGEPTRVIIRNLDNDTSVVGALFRREVESSGPAFQISSDAAEELKITPGKAVQLRVTALVREQGPAGDPNAVEQPPEAPPELANAQEAPAVESAPIAAATPAAAAPVAEAAPALDISAIDAAVTEAAATTPTPYVLAAEIRNDEEANSEADLLRAAGLNVEVRKQRRFFRSTNRILVGPATTTDELSDLVIAVKNAGYADATPVAE